MNGQLTINLFISVFVFLRHRDIADGSGVYAHNCEYS